MGTIIGILQGIWDFISSFISSLIQALEMVGLSFDFIATFTTYLPTVIASGVIMFLSVYLIRFLLLK